MIRSSSSDSRGQAIAELAVAMPFVLLLLLAAVDMGRLFYVYIGAQNAAREGAAYGAYNPACPTASGGPCADPANITYVARQELGGDPALTVSVSCPTTCVSTSTREGNLIDVEVSYPFTPLFPGLAGQSLTVQASATAVIQ